MKFIPEKAKTINSIVMVIVTSIIIMFIILRTTDDILTKSLMIILIGALLVVSSFFFTFLKTLYYEIIDDTLKIRSLFKFLDIKIPLDEIKYYSERITLLNQSGLAGIVSKRFSVGKGYIKEMGKVDMYITSSRKTVFIITEEANYAVSPADMEGFSNLLKKHGVREEYKERDVLAKDVLESKTKLRQYFLLNIVMILILVEVPIALYYLRKLPDYISLTQINSNMLSYVPTKIYLDSMVGYAIMAFILSVVFYAMSVIYSKFDKIYFYRLMLVPLLITSLLLLSLSNTLISIFL